MNKRLIAMFFGLAFTAGVGAALAVPPEEKVEVCHLPPGNVTRARTINIDPIDLDEHLAHGDYEGACLAE